MRGDHPGGPIRWRMHLPVAPERVFEALATDHGRAAFWAEQAVETEGAIHFQFMGGERTRSRVLARNPPHLLSLEYFGTPVRFELTPDGQGGTDLLLVHEGVPDEEWHEVHAGWLNVLFPLKAWVVFGVDLRSHDPRRLWAEGYADQ